MQISHILTYNFRGTEETTQLNRGNDPAKPSYLGIHKTHTCTPLKHVPETHSHWVLQLYIQFQISFLPPHDTDPQAATLPGTTTTRQLQLVFNENSQIYRHIYKIVEDPEDLLFK